LASEPDPDELRPLPPLSLEPEPDEPELESELDEPELESELDESDEDDESLPDEPLPGRLPPDDELRLSVL
jgi:hypothetical protein